MMGKSNKRTANVAFVHNFFPGNSSDLMQGDDMVVDRLKNIEPTKELFVTDGPCYKFAALTPTPLNSLKLRFDVIKWTFLSGFILVLRYYFLRKMVCLIERHQENLDQHSILSNQSSLCCFPTWKSMCSMNRLKFFSWFVKITILQFKEI